MSRSFRVVHRWDVDWEKDIETLNLGNGVQVKILREDSGTASVDMLVKFPPGYEEPRHTHESSHSVVGLEVL